MPILEELLKEIESSSTDEKVKILCDRIFEEEEEKIAHKLLLPKGPNVFLALEVPGRRPSEVTFVSLERESSNNFIIVVWTVKKPFHPQSSTDEPISLKKQRAVEVKEFKPEKILREYAKFIKYMKGE